MHPDVFGRNHEQRIIVVPSFLPFYIDKKGTRKTEKCRKSLVVRSIPSQCLSFPLPLGTYPNSLRLVSTYLSLADIPSLPSKMVLFPLPRPFFFLKYTFSVPLINTEQNRMGA